MNGQPDNPERYCTCVHESGHVIVATALGFEVEHIRITYEENETTDCAGFIRLDPGTIPKRDTVMKIVAVRMAGCFAQVACGLAEVRATGDDHEGIGEVLSMLDADMREPTREAARKLCLKVVDANLDGIRDLAGALYLNISGWDSPEVERWFAHNPVVRPKSIPRVTRQDTAVVFTVKPKGKRRRGLSATSVIRPPAGLRRKGDGSSKYPNVIYTRGDA